jgi:hypothetical protein
VEKIFNKVIHFDDDDDDDDGILIITIKQCLKIAVCTAGHSDSTQTCRNHLQQTPAENCLSQIEHCAWLRLELSMTLKTRDLQNLRPATAITTARSILRLRMEKQRPDKEGSCEYIE